MGQIHGPSLGSPAAIVNKDGRLHVDALLTGSGGYYYQDRATNSMPIIFLEQNKISDGEHYYIRDWSVVASSGGSIVFVMKPVNGSYWTHLVYSVQSDNLTDMTAFEGIVFTNGSAITPINNNRNSTNVYTGSVLFNPTITSSGIVIGRASFGIPGVNPNMQGIQGEHGRENELILKSGTAYAWSFKVGGNNTKIGWIANFYEQVDLNKIW